MAEDLVELGLEGVDFITDHYHDNLYDGVTRLPRRVQEKSWAKRFAKYHKKQGEGGPSSPNPKPGPAADHAEGESPSAQDSSIHNDTGKATGDTLHKTQSAPARRRDYERNSGKRMSYDSGYGERPRDDDDYWRDRSRGPRYNDRDFANSDRVSNWAMNNGGPEVEDLDERQHSRHRRSANYPPYPNSLVPIAAGAAAATNANNPDQPRQAAYDLYPYYDNHYGPPPYSRRPSDRARSAHPAPPRARSNSDRDRRRHRSQSRHRDRSSSRERNKKDVGSALAAGIAGALIGGFAGNKAYKGDKKGLAAGAVVGALGAGFAEQQWSKHNRKHAKENAELERRYG